MGNDRIDRRHRVEASTRIARDDQESTIDERRGRLGTFAGVFTPSILTILGIILFLRLGFVVGNAGLTNALVMIGIASSVSLLTSISLAAVATNLEVKGGGDYYLISRTLGVEFGGAIGIVLFAAQSVSVAFYAMGFGEAVASLLRLDSSLQVQIIALVAVLVLFVLARAGADIATRFQFVVMALLVAALLSFYAGAVGSATTELISDNASRPTDGLRFWAIFAILFPAVTGFTQGVSMSGDLKQPGVSLPRGTFAAVGLSTVVYVSVAVLLAATTPQAGLIDDGGAAIRSAAWFSPTIHVGVIAATLSSAMASFLGGPRILQSLAADRVFPMLTPFAKGHGPTGNPRRAVLLTLAIAIATIGLGSLDVIAPVVSMFFLISYGLLNYATYYEASAASPAFRPRFRFFHRRASLAGAILCLVVMVAINAFAGAAAIVVLFAIYRYLARRGGPDRWADASHSHYFQRATESIRALGSELDHPRNWRPQIVAFSADPTRRERLLRFATWLEGDSGVTAVFRIVEGQGAAKRQEVESIQLDLMDQIAKLDLDVYGRTILVPDAMEALTVIVQSFGVGPLEANTALFGWPESTDEHRRATYVRSLRDTARLGVHVVSMSSDDASWVAMRDSRQRDRRIDVWWDDSDSSRFALLAAYLFTRTGDWPRSSIRLVVPCGPDVDNGERAQELTVMLDHIRIAASVETLDSPSDVDAVSAMRDAAICFVPMRIRQDVILDPFGDPMSDLIRDLPLTAAVLAGAPVVLETEPESGTPGQIAAAEESVEEATARLRSLERQLAKAEGDLATYAARAGDGDQAAAERIEAAEHHREQVQRRVLSAQARLDAAQRDLAALLGSRE